MLLNGRHAAVARGVGPRACRVPASAARRPALRSVNLRHRCRATAPAGGSGGEGADDGALTPLQEQQGAFTYAHIAENLERLDANQLQTALATAIAAEDYALAAAIRDRLAAMVAGDGAGAEGRRLLDWGAMGVPEWVADRVARLGLRFPTEVQRRSTPVVLSGSDAVIQSETGSGKTAAFLVPALSRLIYPPELYLEDMLGPQLLVLVPTFELGTQVALLVYKMFGGNISAQRPGDPANMFTFNGPRNLKVRGLLTDQDVNAAMMDPRWLAGAHVLVGTPPQVLHAATCERPYLDLTDLRVLVADEVDELVRAYPSSFRAILDLAVGNGLQGDDLKPGQPVPWPRWHEQYHAQQQQQLQQQQQQQQQQPTGAPQPAGGSGESSSGVDSRTLSSSGTGGELAAAAASSSADSGGSDGRADEEGVTVPSSQPGPAPRRPGLDEDKVQVVLVGATVTEAEVEEAVARHWVSEPVVVRVGSPGSVPKGLRHRALVVADSSRRLAALVAMLRRDLQQAGQDEEPARVIVFAGSDEAARAAADPLRTALWSEHQLSVLLPSGAEPVKALHAFRDRAASLLLATPSASRGLDLPAVSHVYNLGPPADSKEYLHRAGRAGRIGSTTGGLVTSIVTPQELEALCEITAELGVALAVEGEQDQGLGLLPPQGGAAGEGQGDGQQDLDALKKGLDDIFKLL